MVWYRRPEDLNSKIFAIILRKIEIWRTRVWFHGCDVRWWQR